MGRKLRLIVADDDPDMLAAVAAALEADGSEVVCAATGAELIQRISVDTRFDLLVTDIAMPWMSGLQVALAARNAGLSMPVIIMTALRDPDLPVRIGVLGASVRLLRKPFRLAELQAAVASLLSPAPGSAT